MLKQSPNYSHPSSGQSGTGAASNISDLSQQFKENTQTAIFKSCHIGARVEHFSE